MTNVNRKLTQLSCFPIGYRNSTIESSAACALRVAIPVPCLRTRWSTHIHKWMRMTTLWTWVVQTSSSEMNVRISWDLIKCLRKSSRWWVVSQCKEAKVFSDQLHSLMLQRRIISQIICLRPSSIPRFNFNRIWVTIWMKIHGFNVRCLSASRITPTISPKKWVKKTTQFNSPKTFLTDKSQ